MLLNQIGRGIQAIADQGQDETLSLDLAKSEAVRRYLPKRYSDQFEMVDGVYTRRKHHVPMIQEAPTMTLRSLIPVGLAIHVP